MDSADRRNDLIDQVLARRQAGNESDDLPLGRLGPQEALVAELSQLGEIDWPSDETGKRIWACVAATAGLRAAAPAVSPGRRASRPTWLGRPRWLVVGVAATVALAVISVTQLAGGPHPTRTRPQSNNQPTLPATSSPTASPSAPPTWLTEMRVVGEGGALHAIGTASVNDNFLTCASRSVCYTLGSLGRSGDIARSVDGGVTWKSGEPLPASTMSFDSQAAVSCPRPLTCFLPWGPDILETNDGFAHFQVVPVSTPGNPPALVSAVSCPSALHCVAGIVPGRDPAFAYSDDGGASWTAASAPGISDGDIMPALRCDQDGACMAAILDGDDVVAVTSTDGGRTWRRSAGAPIVDMQEYMVSCADGRNCLVGSNHGYLAWMHTAASGRTSVRIQTPPISWEMDLTAVSCAADVCFTTAGGRLEATRDRGRSWTSTSLIATNVPQNTVVYLSCPVAAGCIALANEAGAVTRSWAVVSNLPPAG